ncbi:FAD-binding protein [Profundibacterium mesophilum]|uniref:FAD-binding protein n=1 Tax=Profundibacterium mesophilum TaxID=1258573 RepID=UPI00135CD02B|nr:FAD-binding protein [Profundibacterium mesophilum]
MTPRDEAELSEAIAGASGALRITGGGTRPSGRTRGEVLSTGHLSGIRLYEPGALTIVAGAGTPVTEVEEALAAQNQRLPFEPIDHRRLLEQEGVPTIGGMVAVNASGPRRIQAGACRDSLIGVRFVDGAGTVIKNGGRVMKNVTGYDLVKLLAGSWGTLGVMSELSFKVLPGIAATATLRLGGLAAEGAVAAMSAALGSPYEVSGAAYLPDEGDVILRIEGFEASVAYRAERLSGLLERFGAARTLTDRAEEASRWRAVRDAAACAPSEGGAGDVWRISVRPSDGPQVAERLGSRMRLVDWGGGLIWAVVPEGQPLRRELAGIAGHATLLRAAPETHAALGMFHPEPEALAAVSRGLRARFDPRGILNPGLMDGASAAA